MKLSLLVAGDFCPRDRMIPLLGEGKLISPKIKNITKQNDISVVNLECPVIFDGSKPISKEGPNLGCNKCMIDEILEAGFSIATLANNHILDYGSDSLNHTIETCREKSLHTVGAGSNLDEAQKTLIIATQGKKIAIINCCEHEYSIASEDHAGSNPLNPIRQYYAIKQAKCEADYVVVIVHGGIETYQLPTPRMKETYRFFVDAGADAVINHHQHCYSGYEVYKGKPIFYGLGNFCFDWKDYSNDSWFEGFMVNLLFINGEVTFKLFPYIQCKDKPIVELMSETDEQRFRNKLLELNRIIQDDKMLEEKLEHYMDSTEFDYKVIFEPYSGRISVGLYWRNLLPSTITKRRVLKLIDYLGCESHFERVMHYLNKQYNLIKQ